jgi:hypothetical protein
MEISSAAVPTEPTITIISSDGETFSLKANTVAHSHLLEGAVRRWAEVYQAPLRPQHGSGGPRAGGSLAGDDDDDATTTDVTADDPEETPDERFIENYYDETASDVTATSGMTGDALNSLNGRVHGGEAGGDVGRPNVMRMVSVPVNGDEEDEDEGGEGAAAAAADRDGDGADSDRTASVLPSSHEGSLSSSTTPTKLSGNNGDAPSPGAAPRSISPFLHDITATSSAPPSGAKLVTPGGGLSERGSTGNGSLTSVSTSTSAAGAGANGALAGGKLTLAKNGMALRSPSNATTSPVSRSSHHSPSTLMNADQSTPSVLSEEEEEEEAGGEDGVGQQQQKPRIKPDPRNLGDEGLDEGFAERQADDSVSPTSPSPSPEAAAAVGGTPALTGSSSNVGPSARRVDLQDPGLGSDNTDSEAAHSNSNNSSSGTQIKPPFPSLRGRLTERRHDTVVVQAGAAEDDTDDVVETSAGAVSAGGVAALVPHDLAGAATVATGTSISAHTGCGAGAGGSRVSASPAPDWRSPSSCHQRTPCIADEDDVGAIVGDEDGDSASKTSEGRTEATAATAASTITTQEEHASTGAAATAAVGSGAHPAVAGPLSSSVNSSAALLAADPDSTVVYKDGIRITSSAIVFDLLQSSSTPMVSPQSLREAGGSLEAANAESQGTLNLSSAGGGTVAGVDGNAAAANPRTTVASAGSSEAATSGPRVNIHSTTLMLCIKYMTHFAEAEAQAAASASHNRSNSSSNNNNSNSSSTSTSSSSDTSSDSEAGSLSGTHTSVHPSAIAGAPAPNSAAAASEAAAGGGVTRGGVGVGVKSGDGATVPPGGPATIPMPLTAPLVTCLSPWERTFLYRDVLGAPEAVLTAAMAIQEVCPDFDYCCPGPYLSNTCVKAALMAPPPPPEGVHALVEVMAAAKQLQIDPLHALCAGWLADFMVRVSYGATDNFEAAHLIRQCLRVPSDWSRRETDCLKLENEWPANEDAE